MSDGRTEQMWKQASDKTWRKLQKMILDEGRPLVFADPELNNAAYIPGYVIDRETKEVTPKGLISYGFPTLRPGMLAHVMGHAAVHENASPLYNKIESKTRLINTHPWLNTSTVLPLLGLIGSKITDNPAWLAGSSGLALALQAPTILHEYRANQEGKKILEQVGATDEEIADMKSSFPSYLAGTLLPAAGLAKGLWSLYDKK